MARHKDFPWSVSDGLKLEDGTITFVGSDIQISILLDIRDVLHDLKKILLEKNIGKQKHSRTRKITKGAR